MKYRLHEELFNNTKFGQTVNTYSVRLMGGYVGKICMNNDFDKLIQDPVFYYKTDTSFFDFSKPIYKLGDDMVYKSIVMKNVGHNKEDLSKWLEVNEKLFADKLTIDAQWLLGEY